MRERRAGQQAVDDLLRALSFVAATHRKYVVLIYSATLLGVLITAAFTL
jgi:hypothetical protein